MPNYKTFPHYKYFIKKKNRTVHACMAAFRHMHGETENMMAVHN